MDDCWHRVYARVYRLGEISCDHPTIRCELNKIWFQDPWQRCAKQQPSQLHQTFSSSENCLSCRVLVVLLFSKPGSANHLISWDNLRMSQRGRSLTLWWSEPQWSKRTVQRIGILDAFQFFSNSLSLEYTLSSLFDRLFQQAEAELP